MQRRCQAGVIFALTFALAWVGCGGENGTTEPDPDTDSGMDDGGNDVVEDPGVDPGADPGEDPGGDPDAQGDAGDVTDEDVDEGPCPGSIICLDEVRGTPSLAICTEAGFPAGTTCSRTGDVACCVRPFECQTDQDCLDNRVAEGFCLDDRYPCVCEVETGECATRLCASDDECADGEYCEGGLCVETPMQTDYVARILTPGGYLAADSSRQLEAVAVDPGDPDMTDPFATINWELTNGDGAITADGVVTAGSTPGAITVTATVEDNSADPGDTVVFLNTATDPSMGIEVYAIDEVTREPLEAADVMVVDDSGVAATGVTDADGIAVFDVDPPFDVHVFADDHQYVSAMAVESARVLIPLPLYQQAQIDEIRDGFMCEAPAIADVTENCGGDDQSHCLCYELHNVDVVRGTPSFGNVPGLGELEVSLTGFALGNSLLDLNFDLLIGPNIEQELPPTSPVALDGPAEIPSGVTVFFNGSPLFEQFVGTAPEGERTLWSVGGIVSLSDNPNLIPDILRSVEGEVDIGRIIASILPLFEDFYSGVTTGIEMGSEPTLPVRDPDVTLDIPTRRQLQITAPALPALGDGWADTGVFLAGALVPGEGFVPLGITAGVDDSGDGDTPDGLLDGDTDSLDTIEPIRLSTATLHGPLNTPGTRYMLASVALVLSGDAPGDITSGMLRVWEPGEGLPEDVSFDTGFPDFAEGSTWNAETRTVSLTAPDAGADFYRVVFQGDGDRSWVVYVPGDTTEIELPAPDMMTVEFEDRTSRNRANVVALTTHDDGAIGYQDLVGLSGENLTDLFEYVSTFSIIGLE